MTLEQMKNIDIRTVDLDTLTDVNEVSINMNLPKTERMAQVIKQLGNPYCFKSGKIAVKINYADTSATIDDRIENYMRMQ